MRMCCSGAAAARKALAAVFEVAPSCLPAKLLEARLMLQEQDHGGMLPVHSSQLAAGVHLLVHVSVKPLCC